MTTNKRLFKYLSFGCIGLLILILICATILEKNQGSAFAIRYIYNSPTFIILWSIATISSFIYLLKNKLYKQRITFLLHCSLILILAGALTTHFFGVQGSIHLRQDEPQPTNEYILHNGYRQTFPFQISLKEFHVSYYPGTVAPMDFVSTISVTDTNGKKQEANISMNNIYSHQHYRFYQSKYDKDEKGTTLSVSYDPYGISITYTGYALLLISIIIYFFQKDSRFRTLLRNPLLRNAGIICFLFFYPYAHIQSANAPKALPKHVAEEFGNLYVYYNDRICPLQTLAKDFTTKLYGKPRYKGLTPEQVLTGWFFFYDDWKKEEMIRIQSKEVQNLLDTDKDYVCLIDFFGNEGYKLKDALQKDINNKKRTEIETANEKFSLISMVSTGSMLKIYPYREAEGNILQWYSLVDRLPYEMLNEQRLFINGSMNYIAEKIAQKDYGQVTGLLEKVKKYQQKELGIDAPSPTRFKAEKIYNLLHYNKIIAIACITLGLLTFIYYCRLMIMQSIPNVLLRRVLSVLLGITFIYLCIIILLRGYVGNHLPISNGFETMQFMAWCTLVLTILLQRKFIMAVPFGFLLCGLTLMVSMLGESNPQVTQLMPVLQSPLLSIHVVVIMIAYSLLAFAMLNGITAVILHRSSKDCRQQIERLQIISQIILFPAVFLLAIGIFVGAVWANVSWGRYWGWDPKEVWALITMLVYASTLHPSSLPWFHKPMFFHVFCIIAFLTVLTTYFGVNFLLGGMHSYAGG